MEAYLAKATLAEDQEIEQWIESDGYEKQLVGIELLTDEAHTTISRARKRVSVQRDVQTTGADC